MSDHLPECPLKPIALAPVDFYQHFPDCICPALRACEERVLDAAREAIKNTRCPEGYEVEGCSHWDDALAAIDALWEKL